MRGFRHVNNDTESPVCWEMQQQEVTTIAFFTSEPLALGSVDEDSSGEITHHRMQLSKEMLCFEEPDRRCKNAACVADANAAGTSYMHFGQCTSANPQGNAVF